MAEHDDADGSGAASGAHDRPFWAPVPGSEAIDLYDEHAGEGAARTARAIGILGLVASLFLPWGAIGGIIALIVAAMSHPRTAAGRRARLAANITGVAGIVVAAAWLGLWVWLAADSPVPVR